MSFHYRKFFQCQFRHSYYGDTALTPDFTVVPSPAANKLIKGYGLVFREMEGGFRLFYAGTEDGGLIKPLHPMDEFPTGDSMDFYMRLKNPEFLHITNLGGGTILRNHIFLYSSTDRTTVADTDFFDDDRYDLDPPTQLEVRDSIFSHQYTLTGSPYKGTLRVKNEAGDVIWTAESIRTEDDVYETRVNIEAYGPGKYTLEKLIGAVVDGTPEEFYVDDDLNPNQVFGVIRIQKEALWESLQTSNETLNEDIGFALKFDHRVEQWKYKIVFRYSEYSSDPSDYEILDSLTTITDDRYNTGLIAQKFFFKAETPAVLFNGYDALVFKSVDDLDADKDFPIYKESKYDLNFHKDSVNILTHLPNPGSRAFPPEVIIYV